MANHIKSRIRLKLIATYICMSLIPIIVIALLSGIEYYNAADKKLSDFARQIAMQSGSKMDIMLKNIEDLSLQIVSSDDVQGELENLRLQKKGSEEYKKIEDSVERALDTLISSKNEIIGVNIITEANRDLLVAGERLMDLSESNDFYNAYSPMESASPQWISTYINKDPEATYYHVIGMVRKIKSVQTGEDLGLLLIGVKEFALAEVYSYLDLGPNGDVFVTDSRGNVISYLYKESVTKPSSFPFVMQTIGGMNAPTIFKASVNGRQMLICYTLSMYADWYMFCMLDYGYMMDATASVNTYIAVVSALIVVVAVVISLLVSQSISKPVVKLSEAMKKVEQGDLGVRVNIKARDEIASLGISFNKMIEKIGTLISEVYQAEILRQNAEINALQSQINPHFLYNTLAMIDGLAAMRGEKDISRIAETLGDVFRYSLSGGNFATLAEEVEQASNYLLIQKYFKREKLSYSIKLEPETERCVINKLLLQPIIENAVFHGIEKVLHSCEIKIRAVHKGEDIEIAISDNGAGMDSKTLRQVVEKIESTKNMFSHEKKTRYHIGLGNVHWRIRNLYGEAYGLSIQSKAGEGTTVRLLLPGTYNLPGRQESET